MAVGARFPQAAVVLALVGAFLSTCVYLLAARERQPDEATLWAAAALWLSLLGAAVFDLSDLARGPREAAFVWALGITVFFAIWVPYVWSRWTALPHAAAWTLAAAAAVPYVLAWLFAPEPHAAAPACRRGRFGRRRIRRRQVRIAAAPGFGAGRRAGRGGLSSSCPSGSRPPRIRRWRSACTSVGAVLIVGLLEHRARRLARAPLRTRPRAHSRRRGRRHALRAVGRCAGPADLRWRRHRDRRMVVSRREALGRDAAAQAAAAKAAVARLRSGAVAGAMLTTVVLCGFLVHGLAWDRSSAQMLAWLRAAGVPDIYEGDIVEALLRDEYLWRDQPLARRRPTKFDSPLDAWTLPEFDRWSGGGWGGSERRRDAGEAVGTGLVVALEGGTATVVLAPEGSPAHAAGIRRGDRLLPRQKDEPADEAPRRGRGVFVVNFPITLTVASPDGNERTVALTTQTLRDRRVFRTTTLDAGGQTVGYVALRGFDPVAEREFVETIASFRAGGVRTLVVDLRYNPGGYLRSAAGIAGAIVGERGRGQVFATTHHNSRYRDRDRTIRFRVPPAGGLEPDRVVVITSGASCSASELLVKGLEPYLPVATVGTTTCGKPVGSSVFDSGPWSYSVISLAVRNARGEGGYFDGLPPTCVAADDLTRELGDTAEASLREALRYIETGRCSAETGRAADESGVVL